MAITIPEVSIRRLSTYLRCLRQAKAEGQEWIQSSDLARSCGISGSLVRKDLSYFGEFGIRGKGYRVGELAKAIEEIIGINEPIKVVIVGAGNLGRALIHHLREIPYFKVLAAFDRNPKKIGKRINGVEVLHIGEIENFYREKAPQIAVLAIPPEGLQETVNLLSKAGIRGILSFALQGIETPPGVVINYVEIASEIEYLAYKIKKGSVA